MIGALLVAVAAPPGASADTQSLPNWKRTYVPSTTVFKGLSPVSSKVVWLAGIDGTVWRTVDGGRNWADVSPPDGAGLYFADVQGFSARKAIVLSSGIRSESRMYLTGDGGRTWRLVYRNNLPRTYLDCISFYDNQHGLVVRDQSPDDGKIGVLSTTDGGRSWADLPTAGMPPARPHEFLYSTSGECVTTLRADAWFATGGPGGGRVFHSADGGLTWDVTPTLVPGHGIGGLFGIAFRTSSVGIAVGGNYVPGVRSTGASVITSGGGVWRSPAIGVHGIRVGIDFLPGRSRTAVAVGLTGSDITYDDGEHWTTFDTKPYYSAACAPDGSCWASGPNGRVARLRD